MQAAVEPSPRNRLDRWLPGGLVLLCLGVAAFAMVRSATVPPRPAAAAAPSAARPIVPTLPNPAAQRDAQLELLAEILLRVESIDARLADLNDPERRP